jgi:prepilin-type N-terminal cleavage/methylation domain-containing protein
MLGFFTRNKKGFTIVELLVVVLLLGLGAFAVMNVILFRSKIFRRKSKKQQTSTQTE